MLDSWPQVVKKARAFALEIEAFVLAPLLTLCFLCLCVGINTKTSEYATSHNISVIDAASKLDCYNSMPAHYMCFWPAQSLPEETGAIRHALFAVFKLKCIVWNSIVPVLTMMALCVDEMIEFTERFPMLIVYAMFCIMVGIISIVCKFVLSILTGG